jgi:hypothetical protein
MAGIRENAVLVMFSLKENFNSTEYAEGKDLMELTHLSANYLNDAVDYLSSKEYIERLDFTGTRPFTFGGIKLNIHGKLYLEELEGNGSRPLEKNTSKTMSEPHVELHKAGELAGDGAVFVTYSWDDEELENRVHAFVNFLREKGFDAKMDKMLSQEQTSVNFKQMMHQAMHSFNKVIVILSPGYKIKADEFKGGVGTEYRMLINDIESNPRKYILFSFQDLSPTIVPFGLQGNEVIVEHSKLWQDRLFAKLTGKDHYHFSPVAEKKPSIKVVAGTPPPFPLKLVEFRSTPSTTMRSGGLVREADYYGELIIENIGQSTIENFSVELSLPAQVVPQPHHYRIDGDSVVISSEIKRIYPDQIVNTPSFNLRFASHHHVGKIFSSDMKVKFYTDSGVSPEFTIPMTGPFQVDANYGQKEVLTKDHFSPLF